MSSWKSKHAAHTPHRKSWRWSGFPWIRNSRTCCRRGKDFCVVYPDAVISTVRLWPDREPDRTLQWAEGSLWMKETAPLLRRWSRLKRSAEEAGFLWHTRTGHLISHGSARLSSRRWSRSGDTPRRPQLVRVRSKSNSLWYLQADREIGCPAFVI